MKEITKKIEYKGTEYKLVFNLNVMEEIQNKYGTVSRWGEITDGGKKNEPNIKALRFGITCMINEGIEIDNDEEGTDKPLLTEKQVGRIISELGIDEVAEQMQSAVVDSTQSSEKNS